MLAYGKIVQAVINILPHVAK